MSATDDDDVAPLRHPTNKRADPITTSCSHETGRDRPSTGHSCSPFTSSGIPKKSHSVKHQRCQRLCKEPASSRSGQLRSFELRSTSCVSVANTFGPTSKSEWIFPLSAKSRSGLPVCYVFIGRSTRVLPARAAQPASPSNALRRYAPWPFPVCSSQGLQQWRSTLWGQLLRRWPASERPQSRTASLSVYACPLSTRVIRLPHAASFRW